MGALDQSWCRLWDHVYFSNCRSFHGELVKRVWFHSSALLFSIPIDSVRWGIEPFCLFGVLIPFL